MKERENCVFYVVALHKHYSNNCCKQDLLMNVKIGRWKFDEKQDVCIVSKYFSTKYLLVSKEIQ